MIKKIVTIRRLGRWFQYAATGGHTNLERTNIIYGDNGTGKTMLAAALDSLRSDEPKILLGRRSLGQTSPPEIQVLTDEGLRTFNGEAWNQRYDLLEVFYTGFVDRNVSTGQQVNVDHKRNLCEFVLGRDSVSLKQRIDELDSQVRTLNGNIREIGTRLERAAAGTMTVAEYARLEPRPNLETALRHTRERYEAATHREQLLRLPLPEVPEVPEVPAVEETERLLETGLKEVASESLTRVRTQISTLGEQGEAWLRYGVERSATGECPFCGQDLRGSFLYEIYLHYFSTSYKAAQEKVAEDVARLNQRLAPEPVGRLAVAIQRAQNAALAWAEYCGLERETLSSDVESLMEEWRASWSQLEPELEAKLADPTEPRRLGEDAREALVRMSDITAAFRQIGSAVANARAAIDSLMNDLDQVNPGELKRELDKLESIDRRFSESINADCVELVRLEGSKRDAEEEKEAARARLEAKMMDIVGRYQEDINHFLEVFGAGFKIIEQHTFYSGGKPGVDYNLELSDEAVPLVGDAAAGEPCLGNTLSQGDMNTLGLAFFLGRLRNKDVKGWTIIFDDPATSLDRERQRRTVQEIAALAQREAQVIVFTHDPGLALSLWRDPVFCRLGCKPLSVVPLPAGSEIVSWDVEREVASGYFRNYFKLRDFLADGTGAPVDVIRAVRPFLEDYLRHRFPGEFTHRNNLGPMIGRMRDADAVSPLFVMKTELENLTELHDATTDRAHGEEMRPVQPPSATEAQRLSRLAFKVVGLVS